ncbi:MAG: hypothetical protein EWV80_01685 [Microcystis aeruginosa Ma_QC_B_20070730_S2]|jgi:hypothetical protein|uniref:Uncharacterized protein n=2 Tax=Microcystis TaxID=1125 RepID=A0A552E863_MICAE|nr:MAG: hypothetical protein EWV80_01685 [Microcystis aeruginosa Ma_QC_B_20070730_S2]
MELIMDFISQLPWDSDQLKETLAKAHRNCQEMELVGLQLEEAISRAARKRVSQRNPFSGKLTIFETITELYSCQ